jgi:PhoPQ-activated pathogenicity-related protein
MTDKTAQEMAEAITSYLNNFSQQPTEELVEALLRQHRTLQQSFSRFCLRWFERLAEAPYGHDLRNEASVKLAQEIVKVDLRVRALPLV